MADSRPADEVEGVTGQISAQGEYIYLVYFDNCVYV